MTTATLTLTEFALDDLDMLDDDKRHARCTICTGTSGPLVGIPFVALCGRRAMNLREWDNPECFPPDACEDCVAMWGKRCHLCDRDTP
jgi:hypothetical protein